MKRIALLVILALAGRSEASDPKAKAKAALALAGAKPAKATFYCPCPFGACKCVPDSNCGCGMAVRVPLPPKAAPARPATVVVHCPADAKVTFGSTETTQTGTVRTFTTELAVAGTYTVRCCYAGRCEEKRVTVRPGGRAVVEFGPPEARQAPVAPQAFAPVFQPAFQPMMGGFGGRGGSC